VLIKATTLRGKKAQTIGSLISSCIKYLTILIAIGFILSIWGVDVSSIVAGLGILTLIIGL
ncbi:MAG: mechanosensitive ion channel family protein, partial [Mollicutes bacterium]|nr:mechanosensitive ion channel family protein [Mollicutes bacterium]